MWRQTERGDLICGVLLRKSIANLCIDFLLLAQNEAAVPKILFTGNVLQWDRQTTCDQLNSCSTAREHHREVKSSAALRMGMFKPVNNVKKSLQKLYQNIMSLFASWAVSEGPLICLSDLFGPAATQKPGPVEVPSLCLPSCGMCCIEWWSCSAVIADELWERGYYIRWACDQFLSPMMEIRNCAGTCWKTEGLKQLGVFLPFFWPASQLYCFQVWWKGRGIFPCVRCWH